MSRLFCVDRDAVPPEQWDRFVERHPRGWWWHTSHWIDYCLAYREDAEDLSFAVTDEDGEVLAVVPLVREGDRIAMGGNPCAGPLGRAVAAEKAMRELEDAVRTYRVRRVMLRTHPLPQGELIAPGWRDTSWQTHVLDLTPPERELWQGLRKSYRSLVRKAEKQRDVLVTHQPWALDVCQRIHREAAGRDTRPQGTWDLMRAWMEGGDAVTALVGTADAPVQQWVGFAYAIRWKRWAYYASGGTLEPNVAHVLQWALVRALRAWGATHYELGWAARPGDGEKEQGISHFKAGWGGTLWTVPACERSY